MKSNSFCSKLLGLVTLLIIFCGCDNSIIRSKPKPEIQLKVFHSAPERKLRQTISKELSSQDYSFDDDVLEITKKEFMQDINLKKHINIHQPLGNVLNMGRRLPELPPIQDDFLEKMQGGVQAGCADCAFETKGDVTTVSKDGVPVVDITLKVRAPDTSKEEDHNVVITMDNYQHTGDFDKKKMEGLAIIEDAENHRNEIDSFIAQTLESFLAVEDENEQKSANGLKSVGDGLTEILTKLDAEIKQVGGDENSGFIFEKKSENGLILALVMAYTVGDDLYEIRMKTRAMDEFEMQIREFLREEDKVALETQIGDILKSPALTDSPSVQDLTGVLNKLVQESLGDAELTEGCEEGIEYKLDDIAKVPNTTILNADAEGGGMDFDFGGGMDEDEGPPKICMYSSSYLSLLEILEMPYVFFSFRNSRLMVEHFIPAIDRASTEEALANAFRGIVKLNKMIEGKVKENMDGDGNAIENPVEFKFETLMATIEQVQKKLKLKKVDEGDKIYFKEGEVTRIFVSKVNGGFKVNFNFPHKIFKDKDSVKPITNEFIFKDNIAYDAVAVFSETLQEFEAAMQENKRHK
jgi:hypothetical protein